MIHTEYIAALILAAGLSSRMGTFKPLLPIGDKTVLERVIGNFRSAGLRHVLVVIGHRSENLIPILDKHQVQWVKNANYQQEMYSSIQIGVRHLDPIVEAFFLMPADMPFVQPRTLIQLLQAYHPGVTDILRPCYQGNRGHPPLISSSVIPHVLDFNEMGGLPKLVLQKKLRALDVEIDDPGVLVDLDKWKDYEQALKKIR